MSTPAIDTIPHSLFLHRSIKQILGVNKQVNTKYIKMQKIKLNKNKTTKNNEQLVKLTVIKPRVRDSNQYSVSPQNVESLSNYQNKMSKFKTFSIFCQIFIQ